MHAQSGLKIRNCSVKVYGFDTTAPWIWNFIGLAGVLRAQNLYTQLTGRTFGHDFKATLLWQQLFG